MKIALRWHCAFCLAYILLGSFPTPGAGQARLQIQREGSQLVITASNAPADFLLETTTNLASRSLWLPALALPNAQFPVTLDARGGSHFFRLRAADALPPDPVTIAPRLNATDFVDLAKATEFLYTGSNAVQRNVSGGAIQKGRVVVLRGRVKERSEQPLPGVTISIPDHPEMGYTLSRADGRFDLVVTGGGLVNLQYQKPGFLPVHRQVQTQWEHYYVSPDAVMTALDPVVTAVALGNNAPAQVSRGAMQTDAAGSRQATLIFPASTVAGVVLENGEVITPATLNIRATEFTVGPNGPQGMPAPLPPNSGYTYCVELSADEAIELGAVEVRLSQPVCFYLENYLGFRVGMPVPAGYYDRQRRVWIPSRNGRVVKVISKTEGKANLDLNGDDVPETPAELAEFGITDEERVQVAGLYAPSQTLWRVCINHFSAWDCNWPYGPPSDATGPDQLEPESDEDEDSDCISGSIIKVQNQILAETIRIAGTPYFLAYSSDRTRARRRYTLRIPLSEGNTVPASLQRIDLQVSVDGNTFSKSFPADPGQSYLFVWDGRDAYGRLVQGVQPVVVRIGYVYPATYSEPAQIEQSFAQFGGEALQGNRALQEITIWQQWTSVLGTWDARGWGLGGWSLNVFHAYDTGGVLWLGTGERRGAVVKNVVPVLQHVPNSIIDAAVGADGSFYYSFNGQVFKVSGETVSVFAGNGNNAYNGEGILATEAGMDARSVTVADDGVLYIFDGYNRIIRRVGTNGIITTFAGNGGVDVSGDGGPAILAGLGLEAQLALAPDGSLYLSSGYLLSSRLRRIGPDGTINTPSPVLTSNVLDVTVGPEGSVYVKRLQPPDIVRLWPSGTITRVAGSGTKGYSGDGGLATNAQLRPVFPGLAVNTDGAIYFTDWDRVRYVDPAGIITTIVGGAAQGTNPPPLVATSATSVSLDDAAAVVLGPDNNAYVSGYVGGGRLPWQAPGWYEGIYRITSVVADNKYGGRFLLASSTGLQLYEFDGSGHHLSTINTITGKPELTFRYGSLGFLTEITDAYNNRTIIERDVSGVATAIVAPGGQRTELLVDSSGYLTSITRPGQSPIRARYSSEGLLVALTNSAGGVSNFTYDSDGRLTNDVDAAGGATYLARTGARHLREVNVTRPGGYHSLYSNATDTNGVERRTTVLSGGSQTTSYVAPDGGQTSYLPDGTMVQGTRTEDPRWGTQSGFIGTGIVSTPGGDSSTTRRFRTVSLRDEKDPLSLISMTNRTEVDGRPYTMVVSLISNTITSYTPENHVSKMSINAQGGVSAVQADALVEPMYFQYDGRGRTTNVTHGDTALSYTYNGSNQLASVRDASGAQISYERNASGQVISLTNASTSVFRFTYDPSGNMTNLTLPNGAIHRLVFDTKNRFVSYASPLSTGRFSLAYGPDGKIQRRTLPTGRQIDYQRDTFGRASGWISSDSSVTLVYDSAGRLGGLNRTTRGSLTHSVSAEFDGPLVTNITLSGAVEARLSYSYSHLVLNSIGFSNASGVTTLKLSRNADGAISEYGSWQVDRNGPRGAPTRMTDSTAEVVFSYDSLGRATGRQLRFNNLPAYSFDLVFDKGRRVSRRTEAWEGMTVTNDYRYDADGQLSQVFTNGTQMEGYVFDANGNCTNRERGAAASYDLSDRLLSSGLQLYSFTDDGFLSQRGGDRFEYGARGELLEAVAGGTTVSYGYDGLGRRVVRKQGVQTWQFVYADPSQPLQITHSIDPDGVLTAYYYDNFGNLVSFERTGSRFYVAVDHLGSPRFVFDVSGVRIKEMAYDSFGKPLLDSNPSFELLIGFAGGLFDRTTGLVNLGFRDYEPETGRWTTPDPAFFRSGQFNLYVYAGNNPVSRKDMSGLWGGEISGFIPDPAFPVGGKVTLTYTDSGQWAFCAQGGIGFGGGAAALVGDSSTPSTDWTIQVAAQATAVVAGIGAELDVNLNNFRELFDTDWTSMTQGQFTNPDVCLHDIVTAQVPGQIGPVVSDLLNPEPKIGEEPEIGLKFSGSVTGGSCWVW